MARGVLAVSLFPLMSLTFLVSCGPGKIATPAGPAVGWFQETGWTGSCYNPAEFEKLELTDRRIARQQALEALKSQWSGARSDGVAFDERIIDDVDTTLLGRPDAIEMVSRKNLEYCRQVMGAGAPKDPWQAWLRALPNQLTAGECNSPFDYQLIQYLEINAPWQQPIHFCKGNRAIFEATEKDLYRIVENGPWINTDGDTTQKATGSEYPCNIEGCYAGQLIGRFVTDSGVVSIFPMGIRKDFEAPENGTLTWQINDTTWYDNTWRKQGTIIDHTAITVSPAE